MACPPDQLSTHLYACTLILVSRFDSFFRSLLHPLPLAAHSRPGLQFWHALVQWMPCASHMNTVHSGMISSRRLGSLVYVQRWASVGGGAQVRRSRVPHALPAGAAGRPSPASPPHTHTSITQPYSRRSLAEPAFSRRELCMGLAASRPTPEAMCAAKQLVVSDCKRRAGP